MVCESCGEKPKNTAKDFTKAVIEINNPEALVLLRKVVIPTSMGDEESVPPAIGKYRNVLLQYETNDHIYLYSSDGIPTAITANIPQEILDSIAELEATDVVLQQEIDDLKNSPDVVDIVPTYADLQAYDTSKLGDNDIIRVLADETHDGQSTYYRWNATTSSWTYIGAVGDYYTKTQVDNLIAAAPAFKPFPSGVVTNGTTEQFMNSILALNPEVGTAYLGTVSLSDMPAGLLQEEVEVYVYSDYVVYCVMRSTDVAPYAWWCASYNYQGWKPSDTTYTAGTNVTIDSNNVISATDTTYSDFTGATAQQAGTSGLVPAPTTSDPDKYLKGDGTWGTPAGTTYTAGTNVQISAQNVISATDTTYSNFVGTDGQTAGMAGLVPAPATTDAGKFLKADGTWDTAGGGGPTVVQTTGTSTTDVMSQNATTGMVFADPGTDTKIKIGSGAGATALTGIAIGASSFTNAKTGVALGKSAVVTGDGGIAIGSYSSASTKGEMNIGTSDTSYGYNSSNYRLLTGLYDGQSAHDAATVGQLTAYSVVSGAGAPTTSTAAQYVGQFYYDTTNDGYYYCTAITAQGTTPETYSYTWTALSTGGGSGPTVVQTTGTSTTDVMSQNAVTGMVYNDPATKEQVKIGNGAVSSGSTSTAVGDSSRASAISTTAIGAGAYATAGRGVAIGAGANAGYIGSIAIGADSVTSSVGEMNIGTSTTSYGYNNTAYRLISGVHDGQNAHDAATVGQLNGRVIQNAGAPTTSTAGTVGQLLEDTTNGKLYICTAIDTTDPQNPSYTWAEVGAGGSGPTVVQTTGTSQTDVMSQNAVTNMIYKDPGTNNKIVIGTGADVSVQNYNMAIGTSAFANGTQSTAVGYNAKAKPNGTALGYNAQAGTTQTQTNVTAIGQSAYGGGDHCTAVGDNTNTVNSYSTAIGASARARSERSVAIGASATVDNSPAMAYSVALGANAMTTRAGEVNVGTGDPAISTVGYNSSAYRVIGGVYDGQDAHDAATVGQLNGRVMQNAGAPTTATVGTVGQILEDTTNGKLYICTDATNPYVWEEVGAGGGGTTEIEYVNCTLTGATATGFTLSADKTATQVKALVESGKEVIYKFVNATAVGDMLAGTYEFSVLFAGSTSSVDVITGYGVTVIGNTSTQGVYTFTHNGSTVTVTAGSIPTVNDATLTIQKNGTTVQTFTANASSNATANIEVPTITMTTTDPGEGAALGQNEFVAVYGGDPIILDYSADEINTGAKWIDGKTIYKKTVDCGALPNNTSKDVAHNISNLGIIIKLQGVSIATSGRTIPLPMVGDSAQYDVSIAVYTGNIELTTYADRTAYTQTYVTLYYTKSS